MLVYGALGLCALAAAALVYRYDLYDREPIAIIALAIMLGAGAMTLAGRIELLLLASLDLRSSTALAALAALVEESLKLLVVLGIAVGARRVFNDPMDGLIYGSMAGLGAAIEEGVALLRARPDEALLLPPEELVRLCGHLVMGGIGGFGVGRAALRLPGGRVALVAGVVSAVALHFGWDVLALRADAPASRRSGDGALGAVLMFTGLLLYGRLVVVASRWSFGFFAPVGSRSLLGWPFRPRS